MTAVRSLAYIVAFLVWLAIISVPFTVMLLGPRQWMQSAARLWSGTSLFLLRVIVGIRHEVRGLENLPRGGAALVVSKHQSMWDTLIFHTLLPDPIYILKKELAATPFFGWFVMKSGCVAVDRSAGGKALRQMAEGAKAALARGNQVIIFPEGTRTKPGIRATYHSGVALLMDKGTPVVPVALNSGIFWGSGQFQRRPGTIVIEFLPALPPEMDRKTATREVESRIEAATDRLIAEALAAHPDLVPLFPQQPSPEGAGASRNKTGT